jgi:hypothetical protein
VFQESKEGGRNLVTINNPDLFKKALVIALAAAVIGGLLGLILGRTKERLIQGTIMGFASASWGMICLLVFGTMFYGLRLLFRVVFG